MIFIAKSLALLFSCIVIVIILAFLFTILSTILLIFRMLNPKFREQYFNFRDICKELRITGNLDLLKSFTQTANPHKLKYSFYYEDKSEIVDDELYNSSFDNDRKEYIKIIESVKSYSLEFRLRRSLKKNKNSNKPLVEYLIEEIDGISDDFNNKDISNELSRLKSKKRFIDYLLEDNNENEQYLETLLTNLEIKIKSQSKETEWRSLGFFHNYSFYNRFNKIGFDYDQESADYFSSQHLEFYEKKTWRS